MASQQPCQVGRCQSKFRSRMPVLNTVHDDSGMRWIETKRLASVFSLTCIHSRQLFEGKNESCKTIVKSWTYRNRDRGLLHSLLRLPNKRVMSAVLKYFYSVSHFKETGWSE